MVTQRQRIIVYVTWMIHSDMPEVLAIEAESFEFPWLEEDFVCCLRGRNCIGMVARHEDRVVGFMIYELEKNLIRFHNFAVGTRWRRLGVGSQLIGKVMRRLSTNRRNKIVVEIRETNMGALRFLRTLGFRAVAVLRDFYEDTPEDAYRMEYVCNNFDRILCNRKAT